jgi:hypothetical protein
VIRFVRGMITFYGVMLAELLDEARHVAASRRR